MLAILERLLTMRPGLWGQRSALMAASSLATNLVQNDTNYYYDIFVHDREDHSIEKVSVSSGGAGTINGDGFNPSISAHGRFIVFDSLGWGLDTETPPIRSKYI